MEIPETLTSSAQLSLDFWHRFVPEVPLSVEVGTLLERARALVASGVFGDEVKEGGLFCGVYCTGVEGRFLSQAWGPMQLKDLRKGEERTSLPDSPGEWRFFLTDPAEHSGFSLKDLRALYDGLPTAARTFPDQGVEQLPLAALMTMRQTGLVPSATQFASGSFVVALEGGPLSLAITHDVRVNLRAIPPREALAKETHRPSREAAIFRMVPTKVQLL